MSLFSALGTVVSAFTAGEQIAHAVGTVKTELAAGKPLAAAIRAGCEQTDSTLDDTALDDVEAAVRSVLQYAETGLGFLADAEAWLREHRPALEAGLTAVTDGIGNLGYDAAVYRTKLRQLME